MTAIPQELIDQMMNRLAPTLEDTLVLFEQSMDKLAGVGLAASKQRQMELLQKQVNLTREFVEANNAEMAAYHSMLAMQGYFLLHMVE